MQISINLCVICIFHMFLLDCLKITIDFLMEIAYGVNIIFYDYHKEKGFTFYLNVRAVLFSFSTKCWAFII